MTATNEEISKKPTRVTAKAKKRIAELRAEYEDATAKSEFASSMRLLGRIQRLENGEPEDAPEGADAGGATAEPQPDDATGPIVTLDGETAPATEANAAPTPSWSAEVREARANAEPEWEWDTSEEVLDIKLTDADMADLLRKNGADEEAKAAVDRAIDTMKADLKDKKAESEAIAARMKDRNRSGAKGVQSKKATWKVGTCFALNTARYIDPLTGRVVLERALEAHERQVALPLPETKASNGQLSLGEPADETDITDADALLKDAENGEASPSDTSLDNEPDDEDDDSDSDDEDEDNEEGSES